MNERIQELALQAQDWVDQRAPFASEEHEWFAEKFAELIVKECIEIGQVGSITESRLKQHFGM